MIDSAADIRLNSTLSALVARSSRFAMVPCHVGHPHFMDLHRRCILGDGDEPQGLPPGLDELALITEPFGDGVNERLFFCCGHRFFILRNGNGGVSCSALIISSVAISSAWTVIAK